MLVNPSNYPEKQHFDISTKMAVAVVVVVTAEMTGEVVVAVVLISGGVC